MIEADLRIPLELIEYMDERFGQGEWERWNMYETDTQKWIEYSFHYFEKEIVLFVSKPSYIRFYDYLLKANKNVGYWYE
jgi:hypothetical protein